MQNHFRPQIQNGPIAKRARRTFTHAVASPPVSAPASKTGKGTTKGAGSGSQDGARLRAVTSAAALELLPSRVLVALVACGALIACGFVFGLHEHFVAYAFSRDEVKVQTKIEQGAAELRSLKAEQRQSVSPLALARAAESQGRVQPLKLDAAKPGARPKVSPKPEH